MNELRKTRTVALLIVMFCSGAFANLSELSPSAGFSAVFENNGGSKGAFIYGEDRPSEFLQAITSDDLTFELLPNTQYYAYCYDGVGDDVADAAYFTDSPDGGVTLGDDGNKWIESKLMRERYLVEGETSASFQFSVGSFDLDSRYAVQAYVMVVDPNNNYATSASDFADVTGTMDATMLSIDTTGLEGQLLEVGFIMNGLNANPETDWGSAVVTMESLTVVPEPAVMGLVCFCGVSFLAARRIFVM